MIGELPAMAPQRADGACFEPRGRAREAWRGLASRGRELLAGRHLRGGQIVAAQGRMIWTLGPETDPDGIALHRFGWLEDLAALGGPAARKKSSTFSAVPAPRSITTWSTGTCSICRRPLEDAESLARGIGPVCADKVGL